MEWGAKYHYRALQSSDIYREMTVNNNQYSKVFCREIGEEQCLARKQATQPHVPCIGLDYC